MTGIDRLREAMAWLDRAGNEVPDGEARIALRGAWLTLATAERRIARTEALDADRARRRAANRALNAELQDLLAARRARTRAAAH